MCITTEIPDAQKFGLLFVPGILFFILFENFPYTSEKFTPTFSKNFPFFKILNSPPPSSLILFLFHVFDLNFIFLFSIFSMSSQIIFCNNLNQLEASLS